MVHKGRGRGGGGRDGGRGRGHGRDSSSILRPVVQSVPSPTHPI